MYDYSKSRKKPKVRLQVVGRRASKILPCIGGMKRRAEVGRVIPCAPSFGLEEMVVAGVGAQRTARPTLRFVGGFLLELRRIGVMNPFGFVAPVFQPARRADWKVGVTAARFMESLHSSATAHWDHEPRRIPLTRPSGTLSPSGGEGWGEGVRFMESFHSFFACIGILNRERRELAPERLGLRRRSLRSRRLGGCSRGDG